MTFLDMNFVKKTVDNPPRVALSPRVFKTYRIEPIVVMNWKICLQMHFKCIAFIGRFLTLHVNFKAYQLEDLSSNALQMHPAW